MQVIQQVNDTEGKGVREKAPMLRSKSLTCISIKQLPCATIIITQEQDTSQIPLVSFQTSLLPSQTCYKGHKHRVWKHSSSLWKKFSSLRFRDVVTASGISIWSLCPNAFADTALMGWLCRKMTSVVDKNHPCYSILPCTIEKCKAEEEQAEFELCSSMVTPVASSEMWKSFLLWITLNPTLAASYCCPGFTSGAYILLSF